MHVLVPGDWTVMRGHELVDAIEADIRSVIENCHVTTHIEPIDDPRSFEDQRLEREQR